MLAAMRIRLQKKGLPRENCTTIIRVYNAFCLLAKDGMKLPVCNDVLEGFIVVGSDGYLVTDVLVAFLETSPELMKRWCRMP